ncbi:hypothetical protein C1646_775922 [Rhizophagus diaphanus]|nr:hypothetical protein C1646_775922 [Rhizophagus diaphanus] [Rhizophagus sp. MUCL 43196]
MSQHGEGSNPPPPVETSNTLQQAFQALATGQAAPDVQIFAAHEVTHLRNKLTASQNAYTEMQGFYNDSMKTITALENRLKQSCGHSCSSSLQRLHDQDLMHLDFAEETTMKIGSRPARPVATPKQKGLELLPNTKSMKSYARNLLQKLARLRTRLVKVAEVKNNNNLAATKKYYQYRLVLADNAEIKIFKENRKALDVKVASATMDILAKDLDEQITAIKDQLSNVGPQLRTELNTALEHAIASPDLSEEEKDSLREKWASNIKYNLEWLENELTKFKQSPASKNKLPRLQKRNSTSQRQQNKGEIERKGQKRQKEARQSAQRSQETRTEVLPTTEEKSGWEQQKQKQKQKVFINITTQQNISIPLRKNWSGIAHQAKEIIGNSDSFNNNNNSLNNIIDVVQSVIINDPNYFNKVVASKSNFKQAVKQNKLVQNINVKVALEVVRRLDDYVKIFDHVLTNSTELVRELDGLMSYDFILASFDVSNIYNTIGQEEYLRRIEVLAKDYGWWTDKNEPYWRSTMVLIEFVFYTSYVAQLEDTVIPSMHAKNIYYYRYLDDILFFTSSFNTPILNDLAKFQMEKRMSHFCGLLTQFSDNSITFEQTRTAHNSGQYVEYLDLKIEIASNIGQYFYKIRDDSVRPREFLSADNENEIEAILSDRKGHSLHEFIDEDEPLRPIINFDLPVETLNAITPKLSDGQVKNIFCRSFRDTCLKIFPKWDKNTISIADSSNEKKISLYILTFGMRLPNIAQIAMFTELVHKKFPEGLQGKEHIRVKKAILPKDGTIFNFILRPPNDESEVVESPLLVIPESESISYSSMGVDATEVKLELVEKLLKEASIEEFNLSFPSEQSPDVFPLKYQEKPSGERKPLIKLTLSESALSREKNLPAPIRLKQSRISNPNDREAVKLKSLIDQAVIKGLIVYADYDFLPYPISIPKPNTEFFNLFLGFLAKPAMDINKEIMDPILWHTKNIISAENHKFNGHLKSFITEGRVAIERKGLKTKRLKDFAKYMVTSNQDAPIKIDIGDSHVVCFDVSSCCRENIKYFKRLGNILNHPDAPGVIMKYLLNLDISDFDPQEIPATKMKSDIMRDQLPTPIRFIINYISPWCEGKEVSKNFLIHLSKIHQPDVSHNETGNIPIFNIPETISQKITLPQPEENLPLRGEAPVVLTSGTSEIFKTPEPVIDGSETSKHPESNEPICEVVNTPPKEITSKLPDSSKPINKVSSAILLSRAQREERLRKKAVKLDRRRSQRIYGHESMERLIGEEIIHCSLEDEGVTSSWLDTDEEWQKNISIL